MDNFYLGAALDFPVYNRDVKRQFKALLKIKVIPHRWVSEKNKAYMGYYRIRFHSTSEMSSFFIDMASLSQKTIKLTPC